MNEPDPTPTAEEVEKAWQAGNAEKFTEWLRSLPPPPNKTAAEHKLWQDQLT